MPAGFGLESLLAFLVMTGAAAIHGSVGFGAALVAAPLLILLDPVFVPGPMLLASLSLSLLLVCRDRTGVDVRGIGWALAGRVPGSALGLLCLEIAPSDTLPLVFAGLILLAVGLSASGLRVEPRPTTLSAAGVLSGIMGTVAATGGPPIALIYQHARASALRGTMAGYFVFSTAISIIGLSIVGLLGKRELLAAATLLPGVVAGYLISNKTLRLVEGARARIAVLVIATFSAFAVLIRYS